MSEFNESAFRDFLVGKKVQKSDGNIDKNLSKLKGKKEEKKVASPKHKEKI